MVGGPMFTTGGVPSREADRDVYGNKKCPRCKRFTPISGYHRSNRRAGWLAADGSFRQSRCKLCQNVDRKTAANARTDVLAAIKVDRGCADCGYRAHSAALDFHHTGDDKSFGLSRNLTVAMGKALSEIAKCVVLCANCHRVRHHVNRSPRP
jgi:hypothetical protein